MATRAPSLRLAAVLITCVLTASCGLFGSSSNGGNADVERNVIRIGVLPVVDVAPLRIALTDKLFEKAGLQVSLVTQTSEAEAIKQLDTTLDLTWATHVSLFRAVAEGTELQLQGEAYQAGPNSMALVTSANVGLRRPRQATGADHRGEQRDRHRRADHACRARHRRGREAEDQVPRDAVRRDGERAEGRTPSTRRS